MGYAAVCGMLFFCFGFGEVLAQEVTDSAEKECLKTGTTVSGNSLAGYFWDGDPIEVFSLACGPIVRYDFVVFTVEDHPNAVIKQVWGLPGDTVSISERNILLVNGEEAKTPYGRPYRLIGHARILMSKLNNPIEGYLLLGHPGSVDSARVGLISEGDILGYVPKSAAAR